MPCERIFLAGFSQGGAIAYATALTHPRRLAGIIALSTYIPTPALLEAEATAANAGLPIFAAHGTEDEVVAPALGILARGLVQRLGHALEWREYPMPHSVCTEEIIDIGAWLRATGWTASPPRNRRSTSADFPGRSKNRRFDPRRAQH